ncbi:MAG: beta-lactamase family protein [Phenylobacterium sp.]|uniref:serine hydrolase domain-containing protein n=1 Tax=Phenylobacterium sp. TaxID=1871053 RepID=UPI001A58C669|nr:serine hydrolase domain-containing protein [Phenylobacterium sp.]MBL8553241.1 beta-lactamase family protein [Phenylobacterium sp.]
MKRVVLALLAALALAAPASAGAPSKVDRAHIGDLETRLLPGRIPVEGAQFETLGARMAALKVPGVSIAFFEDGKVRWVKTYGVADAATRQPLTPETRFQAASMSKAVAAAGALRLVEAGRLSLDGDIDERLTSWRVPASEFTAVEKVTLRRLLSHTAGMTVSGFPGYRPDQAVPTTVQVLNGARPANTPAVRSQARPGSAWSYSGGGYTVAQLAMTDVSGEPFPALLHRLVLRPADMTHSTFQQPLGAALKAGAASGHFVTGNPIPGGQNTYPEYAAAGLWTTPGDYARFAMALQRSLDGRKGALLQPASIQAMTTPVLNGNGLGVIISRRGGRLAMEHSGSNVGFKCTFVAFLDGRREGFVVMTNSDNGAALIAEIQRALATSYGWGAPQQP